MKGIYTPYQFWCGAVRGPQYQRVNVAHFGAVRFAVRLAVLNNNRITVPILVRYGSRSNNKMRTVKINGFALTKLA